MTKPKSEIDREIDRRCRRVKAADRRLKEACAALSDRVREFMFVPSVALLHIARQPGKTLEEKIRIDMELRRRQSDSRRAERNDRGSSRWGTEDVRDYHPDLLTVNLTEAELDEAAAQKHLGTMLDGAESDDERDLLLHDYCK